MSDALASFDGNQNHALLAFSDEEPSEDESVAAPGAVEEAEAQIAEAVTSAFWLSSPAFERHL